jgi:hypothetical protein
VQFVAFWTPRITLPFSAHQAATFSNFLPIGLEMDTAGQSALGL